MSKSEIVALLLERIQDIQNYKERFLNDKKHYCGKCKLVDDTLLLNIKLLKIFKNLR